MPSLIKNRGLNSPGIITFTSGEAIWGLPRISKKVGRFLNFQSSSGNWIFGIHVQGYFGYLDQWPMDDWLGFVMWPNFNASFLSNVNPTKRLPFNCVNFMPAQLAETNSRIRIWDICLISRASSIKRIDDSLEIIRNLIESDPELKIVLIVPDNRSASEVAGRADNNYFISPLEVFSSRQLKNLTFLSSSTNSFGQFPLSDTFISEVILQSKFVMLNSHSEGTPRSLAEALLLGTPVIVSENLNSGINNELNESNCLRVADNNSVASQQIQSALRDYGKFHVDRLRSRAFFCESENLPKLKESLHRLYPKLNDSDGRWHLDDLHLRLACHGQKVNYQFFNKDDLFYNWFEQVEIISKKDEELDEDLLYRNNFDDRPTIAKVFTRFLVLAASRFLRSRRKIRNFR